MEIDVITTGEVAILTCRGRLVLGAGAAPFRDTARRALRRSALVALDLDRVTQMDAHGTGVLAELADLARREGRGLTVARVSDRVRRLLGVTRLDTVIQGLNGAPVRLDPSVRRAAMSAHA